MGNEEIRAMMKDFLTKAAEAETDEEFQELLEMAVECRRFILGGET